MVDSIKHTPPVARSELIKRLNSILVVLDGCNEKVAAAHVSFAVDVLEKAQAAALRK